MPRSGIEMFGCFGISRALLVMATQADLAVGIAPWQAQKGRIDAMRIMASRTFYIWPIQHGFAWQGIFDCIRASKQVQIGFLAPLFGAGGLDPPNGSATASAVGTFVESAPVGFVSGIGIDRVVAEKVAFITEGEHIPESIPAEIPIDHAESAKGGEFVHIYQSVVTGTSVVGNVGAVLVLASSGILNTNRVVGFQGIAHINQVIAHIQTEIRCIHHDIGGLSAVMTGKACHGYRPGRVGDGAAQRCISPVAAQSRE